MLYTLLQNFTSGIANGSIYALIALGYTLVFGILQFINFAHGDVFAFGALLSAMFAVWLQSHVHGSVAGPVLCLTAIPMCTILTCAILGFVIERLAYRPLRNAPRLNVLITAIGVSLLLENAGQLSWAFGTNPRPVPTLVRDIDFPLVTSSKTGQVMHFHLVEMISFGVAVLLMIVLQMIVYRTKFGTAMRAVSFNAKAAALMGINVDRIISYTFVTGSALAGAAGYLYAMTKQTGTLYQPADPSWILLGMKAFVAAVVGGIGNLRGAMVGGLLIGLVEIFGGASGDIGHQLGFWDASINTAQFKDVFVFALLILVLLIRPAGIFGKAMVEKV